MHDLLPIGRFSKITRLTIKALRYYDETGLLKPALVDSETGYRYYSLTQTAVAERIRLLRDLDIPLDEIKTIILETDKQAFRQHLERHRRRIEEQAARYQQVLASLDHLLTGERGIMPYDVKIKEVDAQPIISIRARTSIARIGDDIGQAFGELFRYLGRSFRRPAGPPFSLYHDEDFKEEDVDLEICVPTKKLLGGRDSIIARELPAGRLAYTLHVGPYENISLSYQALIGWIKDHGHEISGPARETYLVGPTQVKEATAYQTEVAWGIRG